MKNTIKKPPGVRVQSGLNHDTLTYTTTFHELKALIDKANSLGLLLFIIPMMRVSHRNQRWGGNLKRRTRWLLDALHHLSVTFRPCIGGVEQAWHIEAENRPTLIEAIAAAQKIKAKHPSAMVVIVTDCRNRFLRGPDFDRLRTPESDLPTEDQLSELRRITKGLFLATIIPPDASYREVCAHEAEIGKNAPRNRAEFKKQHINFVQRCYAWRRSNYEIAWAIRVDEKTIRNWVRTSLWKGYRRRQYSR